MSGPGWSVDRASFDPDSTLNFYMNDGANVNFWSGIDKTDTINMIWPSHKPAHMGKTYTLNYITSVTVDDSIYQITRPDHSNIIKSITSAGTTYFNVGY